MYTCEIYLLTDREYAYKSQQSHKFNALQRWHPVLFTEVGECLVGHNEEENCLVDLRGAAISWASSTQRCVTLSTTEDRLRRKE